MHVPISEPAIEAKGASGKPRSKPHEGNNTKKQRHQTQEQY